MMRLRSLIWALLPNDDIAQRTPSERPERNVRIHYVIRQSLEPRGLRMTGAPPTCRSALQSCSGDWCRAVAARMWDEPVKRQQ